MSGRQTPDGWVEEDDPTQEFALEDIPQEPNEGYSGVTTELLAIESPSRWPWASWGVGFLLVGDVVAALGLWLFSKPLGLPPEAVLAIVGNVGGAASAMIEYQGKPYVAEDGMKYFLRPTFGTLAGIFIPYMPITDAATVPAAFAAGMGGVEFLQSFRKLWGPKS